MKETFKSEGFVNLPNEEGLFFRNEENGIIIISLWVDDFIISYSHSLNALANEIITRLTPKLLLRETHGKLLGMELQQTDDAFYLSRENYIKTKVT